MAFYDKTEFTFAANGSSPWIGLVGPVSLTVAWGSGVSAGAVTFETAPKSDYTGTPKVERTLTYASGAPVVQSSIDDIGSPVGRVTVASLAGGSVIVTVVREQKTNY